MMDSEKRKEVHSVFSYCLLHLFVAAQNKVKSIYLFDVSCNSAPPFRM
jgi:hypothetical protein